jgi:HAMP domain-containing protein
MEDQIVRLSDIKKPAEPKSKPPRKPIYFSLRWKLLVGFSLLFTLVFGIAFWWFYIFSRDTAMDRIQADLDNTIKGAAEGVNGDILTALVSDEAGNDTGKSEDPRYKALLSYLEEVHRVEPRAWIYLGVPSKDPAKMVLVVDVMTAVQPDSAAPFLYEGIRSAAAQAALSEDKIFYRNKDTTKAGDKIELYTDEFGSWVSAYYPVKNSANETVGLVGIDFDANYVVTVVNQVKTTIIFSLLVTFAILFVLVLVIATTLTRPISQLTIAAKAIGEGNYETDLSLLGKGSMRDEINTLTDMFAIMVNKVYMREQTLKRQVEELKIEIDETKRMSQVNEIVDTDFFRELQSKAKVMRQRSSSRTVSYRKIKSIDPDAL